MRNLLFSFSLFLPYLLMGDIKDDKHHGNNLYFQDAQESTDSRSPVQPYFDDSRSTPTQIQQNDQYNSQRSPFYKNEGYEDKKLSDRQQNLYEYNLYDRERNRGNNGGSYYYYQGTDDRGTQYNRNNSNNSNGSGRSSYYFNPSRDD